MSPDNAQSAVTYTSISSDLVGPSWGIPLMNAVHVSEPEHPEYHAPLDDDIQVEDGDEDPEEDLSEEHEPEDDDEDPEEDPNEEPEPEEEDTKEPSEGSDETEPFEEDETAVTPPPSRHRGARIYVRPHTPMAASTQALIDVFAVGSSPFPLPPISPAYDQAPLGHRTTMIFMRDDILEEDMPPRMRLVLIAPPPGYDVAESSAAAARAPRSRAEDVGYVRALQAFEHRMMTSIEEVNLRVSYQAQVHRQESKYFYTQLHDAQTDRRDIRLEIDVVRCQSTAYDTELQESAEDLAVTQMMRIHTLKARARTDMVEDASSSWFLWFRFRVFVGSSHTHVFSQAFNAPETSYSIVAQFGGVTDWHLEPRFIENQVNTNNNKSQKAGACYECGNTGHIKKFFLKMKNRGNDSGNGIAQGRAYALGGRDASPDSNVIT
nr:hypothetical protein [Tanacetum cinerariifolium]